MPLTILTPPRFGRVLVRCPSCGREYARTKPSPSRAERISACGSCAATARHNWRRAVADTRPLWMRALATREATP
jgi:hypothetical protein